MNLKEHYKNYFREQLNEEPVRMTPREAALYRQSRGLEQPSTVERLGGTEVVLSRGAGWNVLSPRQAKRMSYIQDVEGRDVYTSSKRADPNSRAAKKAFTGTRNLLLHGTRQNPDQVGVEMDAVDPPRIFARAPEPSMMDDPRARQIFDQTRQIAGTVGIDLQPHHVEGLDIHAPDFPQRAITRMLYARPPVDANIKGIHSPLDHYVHQELFDRIADMKR